MGQMKLYDYEDIQTEQYGEIGTPRRDQFERQVDEAVHAYRIGEAVKKSPPATESHPRIIGRTYRSEEGADIPYRKRIQHHHPHHEPCVQSLGNRFGHTRFGYGWEGGALVK